MAETPPKDPGAVWRDWVSQWEKGFNTSANQAMTSEEFSQSMNRAMGMSLGMQQFMADAIGRYLANLNLPSRNDLIALGERLHGIESRLDRIVIAVERLAGATSAAPPATPQPPRTKRPPQPGGPA